jgi:hypothetical protein
MIEEAERTVGEEPGARDAASSAPEAGGSRGGGQRRVPTGLVVRSADDEADQPRVPVAVEEDGDPEGLGRALWALVRRDGVETVLRTLDQGRCWHRLDPLCAGASGPGVLGVPGYGLRRAEPPGDALAEAESAEVAEGTWWYALERHGMSIERQLHGRRRHVGFVAFDGPEPSWRELLLDGAKRES